MPILKTLGIYSASLALVTSAPFAGCPTAYVQSRHVSSNIRTSQDRAGLKDFSVSQDRVKGAVTLGGHVAAFADKTQAESIATSFAAGEVVSNRIAVVPTGAESGANAMNRAVTLTGGVGSQSGRTQAGSAASSVPNVGQVVNELHVKNRKATSSN
jgi:osmotically-inducible protein OsmY